jgi:hypothetical protein
VLIFGVKGIKKLISKVKTDNDIDPKIISNNGEVL